MSKQLPQTLALLFIVFCATAITTTAQQPQPAESKDPAKIELGIHFSSLNIGPLDGQVFVDPDHARSEAGAGVRFGYNLTKSVAFEAEVNFFPNEQPVFFDRGGNMLQGQFGVKAGKRFDKFGIFAKARPGFLNFSQVLAQTGTQTFTFNGQTFTIPIFGIERKSFFTLDVGGVVEFYPSRRVLVRFDVGDTMVNLGDQREFIANPRRFTHKLQFTSGIAFRFLNPEPAEDDNSSQSSGERKFEVGAQFSSLGIREFEYSLNPAMPNTTVFLGTNTQAGFGGRFTYHFVPSVGVEVQGDYYPGNVGDFGGHTAGGHILQVQAGAKVGKRFQKFGVFGKVRPGVVSFSDTLKFNGFNAPGALFRFDRSTYFSLDIGGVLEFYPSPRIVARFDGGDTMIRYGGAELGIRFIPPVNSPPAPWEFHHNFQFSAGVGFRF